MKTLIRKPKMRNNQVNMNNKKNIVMLSIVMILQRTEKMDTQINK